MDLEYNNQQYEFYMTNSNNYVDSIQIFSGSTLPEGLSGVLKTEEIDITDNDGLFNYKIIDNELIKVSDDEKQEIKKQKSEYLKANLDNAKGDKIKLSKVLLSNYLSSHPITLSCHNNTEAQYSITYEKQNLMVSHYTTYMIEKSLGMNPVLKWNSTGAECEEWTENEFIQLILEVKSYVEPLVSLQQYYETQIKNCNTQEELDAILINYDYTR